MNIKFLKNLKKFVQIRKSQISPVSSLLAVNFAIVFFQLIYINLRYNFLNLQIPFFYTKPWGETQLAWKESIFYIPAVALSISLVGMSCMYYIKKHYFKFGNKILFVVVTSCNLMLTYSLLRIIYIASKPFKPILDPKYVALIPPFAVAFLLVYFIAPRFLTWAKEKGIVTDPASHSHPAMVLTKPSARGGGLIFTIGLLITTILFTNITKEILGILTAVILLALLGFADDYQNTHQKSKLRFLESPYLRLALLLFIVFVTTLFKIKIDIVNNPFNGILQLSTYTITIGGLTLGLVSTIVTTLWVTWILNLLSWSNGIDGQYCGIVGIASIVIAILALRFEPLKEIHENYAKLAVIAAGASFGLIKYTWHPSKIMWGLGAMTAGIVISSLSILINSKVTTSVLILLIPFLDASITFLRRLVQKKNPLKGDRGHLHHILLDRGWSVQKIAFFYWITTALFGAIGILSAERLTLQTMLAFSGIGGFFLVLLNLKSQLKPPQSQKAGK